MVEALLEHRRWTAIPLCRPQNHNGICRLGVVTV